MREAQPKKPEAQSNGPEAQRKKPEMSTKRHREFRFEIKAYTPETMPLERLVAYLKELPALLGQQSSIHLIRVEGGSTVPVLKVEREVVPFVTQRLKNVATGEAPTSAMEASRRLNRYLREDSATAVMRPWKRGPRILEFPGVLQSEVEYPHVNQFGDVTGYLIRVGGADEHKVPILLEVGGEQVAGFHTNRDTAKALGAHLYEHVRFIGYGYWRRDRGGEWLLNHFRVDAFEPLQTATLTETLEELRAATGEWDEGTYEDLLAFRSGKLANGGD